MPSLTLTIQYQKNQYQVISASELKALFFSNIPLVNPDGTPISDDTLNFWIESAQKEVESALDLKLNKQAYNETREYVFDDWIGWGFIPTTYPAVKGLSVKGFLNTTLQVDYPQTWLSTKYSSDKELFNRNMSLVPVQGSVNSLSGSNVTFQGIVPYMGYFGSKTIPNYWNFIYLTGFDKVPQDLMKAVTLKAAINVLPLASQNVTGRPGIASQSIGVDGLSQSVTTTASAQKLAFGNLIDQWQKELDNTMKLCDRRYCGISFGVL